MATSLLKIDQPKKIRDRIRKHFTRYVPADIPDECQHFCDYLERLACREDAWHTAAIATAGIFRQPAPSNFYFDISTTLYS